MNPSQQMGDEHVPTMVPVKTRRPWTWYALIVLTSEKIVQHITVTLAFYNDWYGIRSTVAVNPDVLMVLGGVAAVLWLLGLWGLLQRSSWALGLLIGLAVFDLVGEFIAQGLFAIVITVSFVVATAILVLALIYRQQAR
jgi:hypothetical protein